MHEIPLSLLDFSIVVLVAMLAGLVATRFKWPPVVWLIIAGAVIGPNAIGLVKTTSTIEFFAEIGSVLLLFAIGVEFNILRLIASGARAITIGLIEMGIIFVLMYEVAIWIGFDVTAALVLASVFSFTSTAIMMKMLNQIGADKRAEVPLLFSILIVQDIVAVSAITFFSALKHFVQPDIEQILFSLAASFAILGFSYFIAKRVLKRIYDTVIGYKNDETLVFFSLFLGMSFSLLASVVGLSAAIGAFLAGSIAASLQNGKELEDAIKPFSLAFSSLFFISIGMMINIGTLTENLPIALIIVAIYIVWAFSVIAITTYLSGFNSESALFAGSAMIVTGEFSLLIARESTSLLPEFDIMGVASIGVLITTMSSFYLLRKTRSLDKNTNKSIPEFIKKHMRTISYHVDGALREFEPSGRFFKTAEENAFAIYHSSLWVVIIIAEYLIIKQLIPPVNIDLGIIVITGGTLLLALNIILILKPLFDILGRVKVLLDVLSGVLIHEKLVNQESKMWLLTESAITLLLIFMMINIPFALGIMQLPQVFRFIGIIPLFLVLILVWDILRRASTSVHSYLESLEIMRELSARIQRKKK